MPHLAEIDILGALRPYEIPLLLLSLAAGAVLTLTAFRRRARAAPRAADRAQPGLPAPRDRRDALLRTLGVACTAFAANGLADIGGKLYPHVSADVYPALRVFVVVFWIVCTIFVYRWLEPRLSRRGAARAGADAPTDGA